jgi:F-type H+-transporting ATPase subunit delta
MRGTSGVSLERVGRAFEPVLRDAGASAGALGAQLYAVVDALDGSGSLRRALSDPARSREAKASMVATLLKGKVDDRVVDVVSGAAQARWSSEVDLADALEELAADAVLAAAQADDALEQVEDELFRLDRALVGQQDLRRALTERAAPAAARGALARRLVDGKVHASTLQLAERAAAVPRGRSMSATLRMLGRLAARRRTLLVASVLTANELTPGQVARLTSLLERAYGRSVELNISVDPAVIGGLRVQVGEEVVEATLLGRLDDARRRLAG